MRNVAVDGQHILLGISEECHPDFIGSHIRDQMWAVVKDHTSFGRRLVGPMDIMEFETIGTAFVRQARAGCHEGKPGQRTEGCANFLSLGNPEPAQRIRSGFDRPLPSTRA